jgi:hypothetical protein
MNYQYNSVLKTSYNHLLADKELNTEGILTLVLCAPRNRVAADPIPHSNPSLSLS